MAIDNNEYYKYNHISCYTSDICQGSSDGMHPYYI